MENPIIKLFNDIPDDVLEICLIELAEADKDGFLKNGEVRKINSEVRKLTLSSSESTDLFLTQMNIYKQAAMRYLVIYQNRKYLKQIPNKG